MLFCSMKFRTEIKPEQNKLLGLKSKVVSIGSCFADHISDKIKECSAAPQQVSKNPFGILFNPIAIANVLEDLTEEKIENSILKKEDDLYCSLYAHSSISETTKPALLQKIQDIKRDLHKRIKEADILILTFGTAWYYYHLNKKITVANCHKIPQNEFEKRLTSSSKIHDLMLPVFKKIKDENPIIQIILTVSPVRHWKDGFRENTISKSNLHLACHQLCELDFCHYFPSYEIQMDELRDYRFYKEDMLHPNPQAIQFIWEKFKYSHYAETDLKLMDEIEKINRFALHKTDKEKLHQEKLNQLKETFVSKNQLNPWA